MRTRKVLALAITISVLSTSVVLACDSTYFSELFAKVEKAELNSKQVKELVALKRSLIRDDHQKSVCDSGHAERAPDFVAAAAGILNDQQFEEIIGEKKTEVQTLRYDVAQLKEEVAELKAIVKELKTVLAETKRGTGSGR